MTTSVDKESEDKGYEFRNLPCNIKPDGQLWCVAGVYEYGEDSSSGVLEWCHSPEDAFYQYVKMVDSRYLYHFRKLAIEPFQKISKPYFSTGNTVLVIFGHYLDGTVTLADKNKIIKVIKITKIEERYGRQNGGRDRLKPLVHGVDVNTGKHEAFDASFIVKVLSTTFEPQRPYNLYKLSKRNSYSLSRRGNTFHTTFKEALRYTISTLPYPVTRAHKDNAYALWKNAGKPGAKREIHRGIYAISEKPFKSWVKRNYTKLIRTKNEQDEVATRIMKIEEDSYYDDVANFF